VDSEEKCGESVYTGYDSGFATGKVMGRGENESKGDILSELIRTGI